ncbi:MAG: hypothetical protein AAF357_07310, partial [Verrucomicrobiota bacterium]
NQRRSKIPHQGFFTVAIPLFLHFLLHGKTRFHHLITPFLLLILCHAGKWNAILVPWSCGYDAFEEMTETLLAATALYWSLLYLLNAVAENSPLSEKSSISP